MCVFVVRVFDALCSQFESSRVFSDFFCFFVFVKGSIILLESYANCIMLTFRIATKYKQRQRPNSATTQRQDNDKRQTNKPTNSKRKKRKSRSPCGTAAKLVFPHPQKKNQREKRVRTRTTYCRHCSTSSYPVASALNYLQIDSDFLGDFQFSFRFFNNMSLWQLYAIDKSILID